MNSNNISIVGHDNCTGCGGCYNSCPKNAISMKYNAEGFLEPVVDEVACISCKKCIAICPVCNPVFRNNTRPDCYAAMAHDDIRQKSSSGGIFTVLAEYIFNKQGVVCGAAYNDDFLVEHIIIDKVEDLDKLRGSKYLQSDSKKVYSEIKKILDTGRDALFCGCPCQVAALNTFLGKEYSNLLTIDLMCHGGPAPLLFKKYLQEKYAGKELERFSFRDKSVFGWSTEANAYFKDGTSEHIKRTQDDYYRAFLPCLSVRKSCGSCKFSTLPRQGDVTLADFWGVRKYKESFDDHKGTSIVIINNEKASKIYRKIAENLKLNESVDFDYIMTLGQPFDKPFKNHPERDRFFEIVKGNSIAKAFNYIKNRKFDVGIIGVWPGLNYGSALTYYGLQKAVKNMGLSPLMIDKPGASNGDPEIAMSHSRRFAKDHFNISKSYPLKELHTLNRHCDSFVIGSDQVWNYGISKNFGKSFYLDFVNDDKKKIAYAVSFGHGTDFAPPVERIAISRLIQRFDAVAVREDDAVDICKDLYNVNATHVLDPVFIVNPDDYKDLASRSKVKEDGPYMLAYILDVTQEKKELMLAMSKKLGLKLVILLDGFAHHAERNKKELNLDEHIRSNIEVYDWLYYFNNASYVLTDSFHGVCYSILFEKQFLPLTNKRRGYSRFASIARLLHFEDRLVDNPSDAIANEKYLEVVDYDAIRRILDSERDRCRSWLYDALFSPKVIESMSSYPIIDKRAINSSHGSISWVKNTIIEDIPKKGLEEVEKILLDIQKEIKSSKHDILFISDKIERLENARKKLASSKIGKVFSFFK